MLKNDLIIFDIETDGLYASKIHCLSYFNLNTKKAESLITYKDIVDFLSQKNITLIGHNIIRYDIPTLERLLSIDLSKVDKIDTLGLSFYLALKRKTHNLEDYGKSFGVEKPKIEDWSNLKISDYTHRCQSDVKINTILWRKQIEYLNKLYNDDVLLEKFIRYINYKLECVREQEEVGVQLNIEKATKLLETLEKEETIKLEEVKKAMPSKPIIKVIKTYKNAVKAKDGNIYTLGDLFFEEAAESSRIQEEIVIEKLMGYEEPNPKSVPQIKDWLYSLGWVPQTIKHDRHKKTQVVKQIPQIHAKDSGGELCNSVKMLYSKAPALESLNGLSVISHRKTILQAFLKDVKEGKIYPSMKGLTNTLRLKHTTVVNLPGVNKLYGKDIRSCLEAKENDFLCGSDLSNIEDKTKRHYIYKYDPQYVEDMNIPGYDAHLEIAILAGLLTKKQVENHKKGIENHTEIRQKSKVVNFSCTYKCSAETLARNSGFPLPVAKKLIQIYWERNKAILDVENELKVKIINDQKWIQNPVSKFWYSLRADKDKFSTLNQGTAVYCFDLWISFIRKQGIKIGLQYHDEILFDGNGKTKEEIKKMIEIASQKTNEYLNLNVKVECDTKFGQNYADVH